jgi:GDP-L-fucose synthase
MDDFWRSRRILVTGGAGSLGSYVVEMLRKCCAGEVLAPPQEQYHLRIGAAIQQMYADLRPHIVINLAAVVGGIGANRERPGDLFYGNLMMGVQLMEIPRTAREQEVRDRVLAQRTTVRELEEEQQHLAEAFRAL